MGLRLMPLEVRRIWIRTRLVASKAKDWVLDSRRASPDANGDGDHVGKRLGPEGFLLKEDADGVDGDVHEGLEHLDEGDGEVDVGGIKYILDRKLYNWPFPISLTMIHMAFCSSHAVLLVKGLRLVDIPANMSRKLYLSSVVPIGALYSLSLWFSTPLRRGEAVRRRGGRRRRGGGRPCAGWETEEVRGALEVGDGEGEGGGCVQEGRRRREMEEGRGEVVRRRGDGGGRWRRGGGRRDARVLKKMVKTCFFFREF